MVQKIVVDDAEFELGYWAIRGLGQPIRFLLSYVNVAFSEVRVGAFPDGSLIPDRSDEALDWELHRKTLDLPFPNLPYLIVVTESRNMHLTQSNAILRFLGRRFDLYGDNEQDRINIDVLQDEAYDYRNWIIETTYVEKSEYQKSLSDFMTTAVPRYIDRFENHLQTNANTTHFVGDRISLVDFVLYELIWQTSLMVRDAISDSNHPALNEFIQSFARIPQIATYMSRRNYIERPINSTWTAFT